MTLPTTQTAVQLVGPGELRLNPEKPVHRPGPHQVLAKSEAVGLCFSDMKLLKQFDQHVRKSELVAGLTKEELGEMPNYVPGTRPTVPGHEVVCRILEVGEKVEHYRVGERYIVQADYRPLKTAGSNGAFGYNFEGGLQEFVLFDERVVGDPADAEGFMIRVEDDRPASQVALVEPWACVENSYVTHERRGPKPGGRAIEVREGDDLSHLDDEAYDDIVYFGANAEEIETLNDKLAKGAVLNIVLGGRKIVRKVNVGVGRIHYGGTRWVGTTGDDPADGYAMIPDNGEIRTGDRVLVVGAGGPMGQMHVIRDLATGAEVVAADMDDARLAALSRKVGGDKPFRAVRNEQLAGETFGYIALMAPVPELVQASIEMAAEGAIVNVFAGIPAPVKHLLDVDALIRKRVFVFGTSGSEPRDMRLVLHKVVEGALDTNLSVGAVSGMAGALDGLRAVEERTMDGKIVVYPSLPNLPLIPLDALADRYPSVAAKMRDGVWTKEAEAELLEVAR